MSKLATRTFPARGWGTLRNAPSPRWVEGRGGDRERRARQDPPSRSPSRSRGRASEGRRTSRWAAQKGSAQLSSFRRLQGFPLLLRRVERRRGGGVSGRGARFKKPLEEPTRATGDARRRHAELLGHVVLATTQAHPLARVVGTGFLQRLSRRHGVARHRRALWRRGSTAGRVSNQVYLGERVKITARGRELKQHDLQPSLI